jgi:predicted amidohydrolase
MRQDSGRADSTRVGLAALPLTSRLDEAVAAIADAVAQASELGVDVLCLPESCLPGHRVQPDVVPAYDQGTLDEALAAVADEVRRHGVATVVGTEQVTRAGLQIVATVIDGDGTVLGHQAKTQLDPLEEPHYVPGNGRRIFTAAGVTFGIAICHEAFRYPETVRWAARAGAQVVFHPHYVGDNAHTRHPRAWCDPTGTYHEKAVLCRALENSVYLASCNYALSNQPSATCVIDPDGRLLAQLDYGDRGVLARNIDLSRATRGMALRYAPDRITSTQYGRVGY